MPILLTLSGAEGGTQGYLNRGNTSRHKLETKNAVLDKFLSVSVFELTCYLHVTLNSPELYLTYHLGIT